MCKENADLYHVKGRRRGEQIPTVGRSATEILFHSHRPCQHVGQVPEVRLRAAGKASLDMMRH